eukprot:jgi/Hompol1/4315/HPOL_007041-RA
MQQFESQFLPFLANDGYVYRSALGALLRSKGRGIVMTVGQKHTRAAHVAISVVRMLGCRLPIEIMYYGWQDLPESHQDFLAKLPNVELVDLRHIFGLSNHQKGWGNKPFAALASSFREVILMDADALFFQKPEVLFEMDGYKQTGALLFRDRTLGFETESSGAGLLDLITQLMGSDTASNMMYPTNRILNRKSSQEIDSGVVVWNKARVMPAMMITCLMNYDPYKTMLYKKSYGDKESFWLAHEASGIPFALGKGNGGAIGTSISVKGTSFICGQLYHPDDTNRPLWFNGGLSDRIPAEDLQMIQLTHWIFEDSATQINWDRTMGKFCFEQLREGEERNDIVSG